MCLSCLHRAATLAPSAAVRPYLFSYESGGQLEIGGGGFTPGGAAFVEVNFDDGGWQGVAGRGRRWIRRAIRAR